MPHGPIHLEAVGRATVRNRGDDCSIPHTAAAQKRELICVKRGESSRASVFEGHHPGIVVLWTAHRFGALRYILAR
jgi:hypothetical protein